MRTDARFRAYVVASIQSADAEVANATDLETRAFCRGLAAAFRNMLRLIDERGDNCPQCPPTGACNVCGRAA